MRYMSWLLFACAAGASAVQVQGPKQSTTRVLLFGCSVDRNAIEGYCGANLEANNFLQTRWCSDTTHNIRMGFMFHPGVGYYGDLKKPFHSTWYKGAHAYAGAYSTREILRNHASSTSWAMLGGPPDLVVVDSSLWDLAVWRQEDKKQVSRERVRQWCQHDLPGLLELVTEKFPTSRIVFRTAPTMGTLAPGEKGGLEQFDKQEIEFLYDCITSSTIEGMLFGRYEIIDYHAIMQKLVDRDVPGAFLGDGFHPGWYPSALYINEILRRVGAKPTDPPEPQSEETGGATPGSEGTGGTSPGKTASRELPF